MVSISPYLPAISVLMIVIGGVIAGPVLGIPGSPGPDDCTIDSFPGQGSAEIMVQQLPESAVLEQARFGADVWRLKVPSTQVNISDIQGRPTVAYKIIIHELKTTTGSSTILSRCHETTKLTIPTNSFEPGKIDRESYNATLIVIYRGLDDDSKVERELASKNITVEVHS